jgi:crotonobetainyl-CoA:carnitine CoA-transferase CaiB-like acyl-CoA transferase
LRPDLIYARISGYGQTGPYASRPGFASVCEAIGGLRHVNGFADRPPVRPNLSLGDTLAGMHAVMGILLALLAKRGASSGNAGQVVDVAIYESVFNMLEGVVPEYDGAGVIRAPSGSTLTGIVPSNTYLCRDGKYVVIGANGDSLFQRLMRAIGRPDLAEDSRLANNAGRVRHVEEIDGVISAWTAANDSAVILQTLEDIAVPGGAIYSVADMAADPHFNARGLFEQTATDSGPLRIPAIMPKLSDTPGRTEWAGPPLGEHTDEVLRDLLGLGDEERQSLRNTGVTQRKIAE